MSAEENDFSKDILFERLSGVGGKSLLDERGADSDDIIASLFSLIRYNTLTKKERAFIGGLLKLFMGYSPYHRIKIEKAPTNRRFKNAENVIKTKKNRLLVEKIEIEQLHGEKLEYLIEKYAKKFSISRR